MRPRPSLNWKATLSLAALIAGCASAPPPPPKELTCLLRAPKSFPPAEPGALECFDPVTNRTMTIPFEDADKYICQPPAARREQDLYLKLRGI